MSSGLCAGWRAGLDPRIVGGRSAPGRAFHWIFDHADDAAPSSIRIIRCRPVPHCVRPTMTDRHAKVYDAGIKIILKAGERTRKRLSELVGEFLGYIAGKRP